MKNFFSIATVVDYVDIHTFYEKFLENTEKEREVDWDDLPLKTEIKNISEIREIKIKNKNINYFTFDISTERKKTVWFNLKNGEFLPREARVTKIETAGIVFEESNTIKIIFLCGVENINKFKVDIFNSYTNLDIRKYFTEDMLFWLFWSFDQNKDNSLNEEEEFYINDLTTYTGVSQDNKNEIKVDGEKTSVLLATLGSIFSSRKFKLLTVELDYLDENIAIEIRETGTYKINPTICGGECERFGNRFERIIYLLTFCEIYIFPKLKESYKLAIEKNKWNELIQLSFTEELGVKIIALVEEGLKEVRKQLLEKNEENKQRLFHENIVK